MPDLEQQIVERPKWTVFYNIASKENDRWVGTGWEFFDSDGDATTCYLRHNDNGNCAGMRPFYSPCDNKHLGAAHAIPLPSPAEPSPQQPPVTDADAGAMEMLFDWFKLPLFLRVADRLRTAPSQERLDQSTE